VYIGMLARSFLHKVKGSLYALGLRNGYAIDTS